MGISTVLKWIATCILFLSSSLMAADELITKADPEAGKLRSVICIGCHGLNGEGKEAVNGQPAFPRIAGQVQSYLIKSVNDYKNDRRNDPMMAAIAKGLSETDIVNLAAFYSSK
ncbi:MAG: cytochrome c [Gammaproteobacteria bacterium]|nr:cytochrome c [Gammaproteobacteria bacterium]